MHRAHAPGACTRRMHGRMHRAHAPGACTGRMHQAHARAHAPGACTGRACLGHAQGACIIVCGRGMSLRHAGGAQRASDSRRDDSLGSREVSAWPWAVSPQAVSLSSSQESSL